MLYYLYLYHYVILVFHCDVLHYTCVFCAICTHFYIVLVLHCVAPLLHCVALCCAIFYLCYALVHCFKPVVHCIGFFMFCAVLPCVAHSIYLCYSMSHFRSTVSCFEETVILFQLTGWYGETENYRKWNNFRRPCRIHKNL